MRSSTLSGSGINGAVRPEFAETLRLAETKLRLHGWQSAPLGMAVHGLVIGGFALLGLQATNDNAPPPFHPRLMLQLAPPPPPPRLRGTTTESSRSKEVARTAVAARMVVTPMAVPAIPETFLASAPAIDLSYGFDDGFDDGEASGMPSGVSGGVTGGVPGGLVGGVVGGTGNATPRFAKPDVGPSPIRMPQPDYTEEAIRNNVTGWVVLRVVIDERGKVSVLEILRSVPELDAEAIRVVETQWQFQPATRNGRPIPTLSDLKVRFQLH